MPDDDRRRRAAAARRRVVRRARSRRPTRRTRDTQYYEMLGCRAIYHDGWKAVVFHPMMGFAYDGQRPAAAVRRRPVGAVPRRRGLLRERRPRRRGAGATAPDDRPVVVGGRAQPGAAADQPARAPRRPALAAASATSTTRDRPAAGGRGAEPAQPRVHGDRRAGRAGGWRRRRGDPHPRRRGRRLRDVRPGRHAALDRQPARRRRSRRSRRSSRCPPARAPRGGRSRRPAASRATWRSATTVARSATATCR